MAVSPTEFVVYLLVALLIALAVVIAARALTKIAGRKWPAVVAIHNRIATPFRLFLTVAVITGVVGQVRPEGVSEAIWNGVHTVFRLLDIGAGAWLVGAVLLYLEDLGLRRYDLDGPDNLSARRVQTQVRVIKRLTVALVVIVAVGAGLLSFPGVRAVGASLLASAGLVSVVAAVAAQSTLSNVFAGIQLAFNNAIRIDDVVVVDEQWGRVEEMTLSYVVVRLWDDRRLVLPSTWFTSQPFENWTHSHSELVGAVEIDLDWRVDTAALRDRLGEVLSASDQWDGRSQNLQVTDATGGIVRIRALMSASDAAALWDLRCIVREELVTWSREHSGATALPRQRVELVGATDDAEPQSALR
jgi:small-conductance mechanosensitive channel